MEFHKTLQNLRKQKGLTQEELAQHLYVSRTAISKWESGKGYPNIDSLKAIAAFFGVTVDELLSGGEVLTIAEEDRKQQRSHNRDLVFGLLDCATALMLFLPFFGQAVDGTPQSLSLLMLAVPPYLKVAYFAAVIGSVLTGIATLALQNCQHVFWLRHKTALSLGLSAAGSMLFILSRQPYAAAFIFVFLIMKIRMTRNVSRM